MAVAEATGSPGPPASAEGLANLNAPLNPSTNPADDSNGVESETKFVDHFVAVRDKDRGASASSAVLNLIKGNYGTGVLTLPHAFTNSGTLGSLIVGSLSVLAVLYSMLIVVPCKTFVEKKRLELQREKLQKQAEEAAATAVEGGLIEGEVEMKVIGQESETLAAVGGTAPFSDTTVLADGTGPLKQEMVTFPEIATEAFGKWGGRAVFFCVALLPATFCIAYVVVIIDITLTMVDTNKYIVALFLLPPLLGLAMLRHLKNLTVTSYLGVAIYGFVVYGVLAVNILRGNDPVARESGHDHWFEARPIFIWDSLFRLIPIMVYSIEANLMVIPLENSLREPRKIYSVLTIGTVFTAFTYMVFALTGYLAGYGQCEIATNCLPEGAPSTCLNIALIIALLFSHPVQMYCTYEVMEEAFLGSRTGWKVEVLRRVYRACMVLATIGLGTVIPSLTSFMGIVGGLLVPFLGFVIPPMMYLIFYGSRLKAPMIILNVGFIVFGVLLGIYSIFLSIQGAVEHSKH